MKGNDISNGYIRKCEAVSDTIGVVLMVSLVAIGIGMVGVIITGQSTPTELPSLSMIPDTTDTDLLLYHNGGDSLKNGEFYVRVDGIDYYPDQITLLGQDGGSNDEWDSWDVGETLEIPGESDYSQVLIISTKGGQGSLIASSGEGIFTTTPTSTATSTSTATVTETSTPSPGPDADFTANVTSGPLPLSVLFTDLSTGSPTSRLWDFGDGNTSTEQNPAHLYTSFGTYTVSLTVTNADGSDTETKTAYISVLATSTCENTGLTGYYYRNTNFQGTPVAHTAQRLRFSDNWGHEEYGYESDIPNWPYPIIGQTEEFSVIYEGYFLVDTEDDYTFNLTSDDGSRLWIDDMNTPLIDNWEDHPPESQSAPIHLTEGYHPIRVTMYEQYEVAVLYLKWSSSGSPDVDYMENFCMDDCCHDSPEADFEADVTSGPAPLTVGFTDLSTGSPTSWFWDFGDGTNSTGQNPEHEYTSAGTYTVSLRATNAFGSNTEEKTDYIDVSVPRFDVILNTDRSYYLTSGSELEFDVIGIWSHLDFDNSYIGLPQGTNVRIVLMSDQDGSIYMGSEGTISTLEFDDVNLYIDGVLTGSSGSVSDVWVSGYSDMYSTLSVVVPYSSSSTSTSFYFDDDSVEDSSEKAIFINNIYPDSDIVLNLNRIYGKTYLKCGADSYELFEPPSADFDSKILSSGYGWTGYYWEYYWIVEFTDTSDGDPTSWSWDFGDGDTITEQSPTHTFYYFTRPYKPTVSLTVSNAYGNDITSKRLTLNK